MNDKQIIKATSAILGVSESRVVEVVSCYMSVVAKALMETSTRSKNKTVISSVGGVVFTASITKYDHPVYGSGEYVRYGIRPKSKIKKASRARLKDEPGNQA